MMFNSGSGSATIFMKIYRLLYSIILLTACSVGESSYYFLREKPVVVNDSGRIVKAKPIREIARAEEYDIMDFEVYDSLCIIYSNMHPKGFFSIMNLNTEEEIGLFCRRGRGPNESSYLLPNLNFKKNEKGEVISDIIDWYNNRMFSWNITRSIEENNTVYDTVRHVALSDISASAFRFYEPMDDTKYMAVTFPLSLSPLNQVAVPRYWIRSSDDNSLIREYEVFKDTLQTVGQSFEWFDDSFFSGPYCMKPDKSKLAMAMSSYPQLNIIDLRDGTLKCYKQKDREASMKVRMFFYADVHCDDEYIYALYADMDITPNQDYTLNIDHNKPAYIHKYDWDGNLVCKYELDGYYNKMAVDNGLFYLATHATGRMKIFELQ